MGQAEVMGTGLLVCSAFLVQQGKYIYGKYIRSLVKKLFQFYIRGVHANMPKMMF